MNDLEIIGGDEIIGTDEVYIGAIGPQVAAQLAQARAIDPSAVLVRSRTGSRKKKLLPVPATSVGAGATVLITVETQETFRPERFIVEAVNIASFTISDIKVGTKSQFAGDGACPADAFRPDSVDVIEFDTLNIGSKLILTVTNTSAGALTFRGVFFGTSVG